MAETVDNAKDMVYKWSMKDGRMADKEVRVKLDGKTYSALRSKAKREMRSMTKQVVLYIQRGVEAQENRDAR